MSSLGAFHQKGFTLVELLIVIVVIGILASITVVAYNGVTVQARNAARLATTKQANQAVRLAIEVYSVSAVHASLNHSDDWGRACVGIGHPNLDNDGANIPDCGRYLNDPAYVSESTAFNNLLRDAGMLPNMQTYQVVKASYGDVVAGPFLEDMVIDGTDRLVLEYNLEGDAKDCSLSPLVYGDWGARTMTRPASGAQYSSTGGGITECRILVADL